MENLDKSGSTWSITRRRVVGGIAGLGLAGLVKGEIAAQTCDPAATACTDPVIPIPNQKKRVVIRDETDTLTSQQIDELVTVIRIQIDRDFTPVWGISASVEKWLTGTPAPEDSWRVIIRNVTDSGHDIDTCGTGSFLNAPIADVVMDCFSTLVHAVSHECLEMLANPFNTKVHRFDPPPEPQKAGSPAPTPTPADCFAPRIPKKALYEHEICDPCKSIDAGYTINCRKVSDFVVPAYFDPYPSNDPKQRYSFVGGVTQPLTPSLLGYQNYSLIDTGESWVYEHLASGLNTRKR
jgi:hypothetical protein